MVKTCAWGRCNSDTRRPERIQGVHFIPFPKPKTQKDRCLRWIKACGRPHYQLNESRINRHTFVCTKHFVDPSGPTEGYPDPIPSDGSNIRKSRRHWRERSGPYHNIQQNSHTTTASDTCTTSPKECIDEIGESSLDRGPTPAENCFEGLSLLADSCQIDHLMQKKLQETEEKLHHQTVLNQHLNLQLSTIRNQPEVQIEGLNIEKIIQQEKKITGLFFYYTNLKHSTFVTLYNILTEQQMPVFPKKRKDVKTMKPETQLLLTLMRLRHNFGLKDLAARFLISTQSVSEIFSAWIEHMYLILGSIPIWPHRNDIIRNMPSQFRVEFPDTLAIIDCTELKTQKPSSLKLQSQMYSDYKSATTLKGLVACDPMGNIIFVSELFTGSMSDVEITAKSGFYKLLEQLILTGYIHHGDSIMADKGFTISGELQNVGLHLNLPSFVNSGIQMCQADVEITQKIAAHRIHVERAIRKIRTFKILSGCIPTSLFGSINKIWTVCVLQTLWQNPVLKNK